MKNKTVSLALGSGGARGLAHIGVIEVLEAHGYEVKSIAGASIGALVGGIYALGKLNDFSAWVIGLKEFDVLKYLDVAWGKSGLFDIDKGMKFLRELTGDAVIENLRLNYTAVAVDVEHEREIWLSRGSVYEAIRASISLPGIFTPCIRDGLVLVDGGVLNPVPIAPMMRDDNDLIIAVNLGGRPMGVGADQMYKEEEISGSPFILRVTQAMESLTERISPKKEKHTGHNAGFFDILGRSFDTMQSYISVMKLAAYPPDILIDLPRDMCAIHEFYRAKEMIELGRNATERALQRLQ